MTIGKASALDVLYLGLMTACSLVVAFVAAPASMPWLFYGALALHALACVLEVLAVGPKPYFTALAAHAVASLVLIAFVVGRTALELALLGILTLGICIHNPFPLSTVLAASASGLTIMVRAFALAFGGAGRLEILRDEASYAAIAAVLTAIASLTVRYRERLIDSQGEVARLDALVQRLAHANMRYQEYAKVVEEASTENERKRIIRDIHDTVGYTLTNNITMMEAITAMIGENPLGVPHLVSTARENAREGLARVRETLHLLRGNDVEYPTGLVALQKLLRVFEKATGVGTEFAFTDVAWDFSESVDSAFYHVVQESLMNSFCHGKATRIRIFLARHSDQLVLRIKDNGVGADGFVAGIGLSGMKERIERLGGRLTASSAPGGGFDVTATVPAAGPSA